MKSTMFASAVVMAGSLALAGGAVAADGRSRTSSARRVGPRVRAGVARLVGGQRATASTPRASSPSPRTSSSPATRASSPASGPPTRLASDQGSPRTAPAGSEPIGTAVARGGDSGGGSIGGGSSQPISSYPGPETIQSTSGRERHAPAGSTGRSGSSARPRGGRTAVGTAEGRTHPPYGGGGGGGWGGHDDYYYWGYGGLGLGYFYYDPFWWGPGWGYPYGGGYGGYGGGYGTSSRYAEIGQLRLKVKPKNAQVYVDGAFAGTVDEFDGTFQRLDLEEGPHRVELKLEGHAPLMFEVNIIPNELVTYRGELDPKP